MSRTCDYCELIVDSEPCTCSKKRKIETSIPCLFCRQYNIPYESINVVCKVCFNGFYDWIRFKMLDETFYTLYYNRLAFSTILKGEVRKKLSAVKKDGSTETEKWPGFYAGNCKWIIPNNIRKERLYWETGMPKYNGITVELIILTLKDNYITLTKEIQYDTWPIKRLLWIGFMKPNYYKEDKATEIRLRLGLINNDDGCILGKLCKDLIRCISKYLD